MYTPSQEQRESYPYSIYVVFPGNSHYYSPLLQYLKRTQEPQIRREKSETNRSGMNTCGLDGELLGQISPEMIAGVGKHGTLFTPMSYLEP